ncbi:MAG: integrase core domain-containing protein [Desulfarculus sp.]|nr:integrase core domain-containing protein [Desulfarculus sp.]
MIERLWRSLNHACIYCIGARGQARKGIGTWIAYHNQRRPRSSLYGQTPDEACWPGTRAATVAAAA